MKIVGVDTQSPAAAGHIPVTLPGQTRAISLVKILPNGSKNNRNMYGPLFYTPGIE